MMNRPLFPFLLHRHMPLGVLAAVSILLTGCGKKQPDGTPKGGTASAPWPGYTIVQELGSSASELIDMEGRLVHRWPGGYPTGGSAYLRPDGSLLRVGILQPNAFNAPCPGMSGAAEIVDWDGNQLWTFEFARSDATLHHDIVPMPNGNILMIGVEKKTKEEQIEAGRDPSKMRPGVDEMWFDFLIEVKPTGRLGGEIVWEWRAWDHLIQDFDPKKKNYGVVADRPDKIDINFMEENVLNQGNAPIDRLRSLGYVSGGSSNPQAGPGQLPDWAHVNSVAYNPETDEILMSARDTGELWIIRHGVPKDAKDSGLIYRWGNPQAYQRGTPKDRKLWGQHDAHWIAPGLKGAGNILLFNNGESRKDGAYSTIDEFTAPRKSDGTYELDEGAAYGPEKMAWQYKASPKESFYSQFLSGVQRLPNGNTLICSGVEARIFEVTAEGATVWKKEYLEARTEQGQLAGSLSSGGSPQSGPGQRPGAPQPYGAHGLTAAEIAFLLGPDSLFSPPRPPMESPDTTGLPPGMASGPGGMGGGPGGGGPGGMGGGPGGGGPGGMGGGPGGGGPGGMGGGPGGGGPGGMGGGPGGGGPGGMGGGPGGGGPGGMGGGPGNGPGGSIGAVRKGLFRAVRYELDHPAFKGRKLTASDSSQ